MLQYSDGSTLKSFRYMMNACEVLFFFPLLNKQLASTGSLGARINELKQRVIAENPHRYAVAVPREGLFPPFIHSTLISGHSVITHIP